MVKVSAYQYGGVIMKCDECGYEWELYKATYCPRCGSALCSILREEPMTELNPWRKES